jgi:glycosyltransferase involved in cell wall biosynthesis
MSLGIPVITSHSPSLRETAGDAALLVDPTDPQALSQAVFKLIGSRELRQSYSKKGISRAKKFSWQSTAKHTLKIYEKAENG